MRKRDAFLDGGMAVEDELNPRMGLAFGEINFRQFFHAGDEGGAGWDRFQRISIRLALHGARIGIHCRQQHQGK